MAGIAFYLTYTDSPQSHLTVGVCKGAFKKDIIDDQDTKATTLRRLLAEPLACVLHKHVYLL